MLAVSTVAPVACEMVLTKIGDPIVEVTSDAVLRGVLVVIAMLKEHAHKYDASKCRRTDVCREVTTKPTIFVSGVPVKEAMLVFSNAVDEAVAAATEFRLNATENMMGDPQEVAPAEAPTHK